MPVLFQQQAGGDVLTADQVRASLEANDVVRCKRVALEAAAALEAKATQEAAEAAEAEKKEAPDSEAFIAGQLDAPPDLGEQDQAQEVCEDAYGDLEEQERQFQIAEDDAEGIQTADEAADEADEGIQAAEAAEMMTHFGGGETGSGTAEEEEGSGTEAESEQVGTCSS